MSNQYCEGWFPECEKCKCGNLGNIVCATKFCVKKVDKSKHYSEQDAFHQDHHWWKKCAVCGRLYLSDPGSFGVYAICINCAKGMDTSNMP